MHRSLALVLLAVIIALYPQSASAQTESLQSVMTGAGELLVGLDISHPEGDATLFKITFYHPEALDRTEDHIYYDFLIMKEGKTIFRAAGLDDSPVGIIHSITGTEEHAFLFDENGAYTARVVVYGLRMVFVEPVYADFPVTITPEFHLVMPIMALAAGALVFMRFGLKRPN